MSTPTPIDIQWIIDMGRAAHPRSKCPASRFLASKAEDCDPDENVVPAWLAEYFEAELNRKARPRKRPRPLAAGAVTKIA